MFLNETHGKWPGDGSTQLTHLILEVLPLLWSQWRRFHQMWFISSCFLSSYFSYVIWFIPKHQYLLTWVNHLCFLVCWLMMVFHVVNMFTRSLHMLKHSNMLAEGIKSSLGGVRNYVQGSRSQEVAEPTPQLLEATSLPDTPTPGLLFLVQLLRPTWTQWQILDGALNLLGISGIAFEWGPEPSVSCLLRKQTSQSSSL